MSLEPQQIDLAPAIVSLDAEYRRSLGGDGSETLSRLSKRRARFLAARAVVTLVLPEIDESKVEEAV